MAQYVAIAMVFFDGGVDGAADAWAQGNAQWIKDNTQVLAAQASLVSPGTASERTSYCQAAKVLEDGTLEHISGWYVDEHGQVQQGRPGEG